MQLYPDLFDGVRTIKNAVVHLDVKPGAIPIVCSPRRVPDTLRDSLKEELNRMESVKVIRKLDINKASDWVHDTPWGCYCFLKLPFGLCESQYFFQFYMDLNFKAINKGTHIIINDVLIVGSDSSSTGSHDYHLIQVLNKCHEIGLKLNPDECIFKSMQVLFFRHLVTSDELKPDPRKINAIAKMPALQNKTTPVFCQTL